MENGSAQQSQTHKKSNRKAKPKLMAMTSPSLILSNANVPPLVPVLVAPTPPAVIVVPITLVEVPLPATIVELGPGLDVADATALRVDGMAYGASVVRIFPIPTQNPPRVHIVE